MKIHKCRPKGFTLPLLKGQLNLNIQKALNSIRRSIKILVYTENWCSVMKFLNLIKNTGNYLLTVSITRKYIYYSFFFDTLIKHTLNFFILNNFTWRLYHPIRLFYTCVAISQ